MTYEEMTKSENSDVQPKTRTETQIDPKDVALQGSELPMIGTLPAPMSRTVENVHHPANLAEPSHDLDFNPSQILRPASSLDDRTIEI
jgi:hypothetical protein